MLRLLISSLLATIIAASGCANIKTKKTTSSGAIFVYTDQLIGEINPQNTKKWFVLIEGDGAAWPTPNRPPIDPTPRNPIVLRLADIIQQRTEANVLYLARPCQYPEKIKMHCRVKDWTIDRFAARHVEALMNTFMNRVPIGSDVTLFGFSGGGVMALQLAGLLRDRYTFQKIVLAGTPVDVNAWTESNGYSQLTLENYPETLGHLASGLVPIFALFGDLDTTVSDKHLGIADEVGLTIKAYLLPNTSHANLPVAKVTIEILTQPQNEDSLLESPRPSE